MIEGTGIRTRKPSVFKKKNSLSRLIGPPNDAAHWLALLKGRSPPSALLNQSFASIARPVQ